ncbi:hypothetical protein ACQQ2N_12200 [Dokdonella sp. MW10]|uniref:hypothetical protein n=1 Tax=Dokdonella sp. MW10 TaxID=2992926 RepID=UPI003F7E67DE
MLINRIDGATRYLGAPAGWKPEDNGECAHLAIVDVEVQGGANVMVSSWQPTPDEIRAIAAGAPIYLHVWGTAHPPVAVAVGPVPR